MQFHHPKPALGTTRQRTKFLLLPVTIGEHTRWLEFAKVEETYMEDPLPDSVVMVNHMWVVTRFLD